MKRRGVYPCLRSRSRFPLCDPLAEITSVSARFHRLAFTHHASQACSIIKRIFDPSPGEQCFMVQASASSIASRAGDCSRTALWFRIVCQSSRRSTHHACSAVPKARLARYQCFRYRKTKQSISLKKNTFSHDFS